MDKNTFKKIIISCMTGLAIITLYIMLMIYGNEIGTIVAKIYTIITIGLISLYVTSLIIADINKQKILKQMEQMTNELEKLQQNKSNNL